MKISFQGPCYHESFISVNLFADLHPKFFAIVGIFIFNITIYIDCEIKRTSKINRLNSISDYAKIRFGHAQKSPANDLNCLVFRNYYTEGSFKIAFLHIENP